MCKAEQMCHLQNRFHPSWIVEWWWGGGAMVLKTKDLEIEERVHLTSYDFNVESLYFTGLI